MLPTDGRCARLSIGAAAAQLRLQLYEYLPARLQPLQIANSIKPADSAQPAASCLRLS